MPLVFDRDVHRWRCSGLLVCRSFTAIGAHIFEQHRNSLQLTFGQSTFHGCQPSGLDMVQQIRSGCHLFNFQKLLSFGIVIVTCSLADVEPLNEAIDYLATGATLQNVGVTSINPLLHLSTRATAATPSFRLVVTDGSGFGCVLAVKFCHGSTSSYLSPC